MIDDIINEIKPYYDENLNHYKKYSYLLTFVDKVPIEKYKHCDPFINDKGINKQYIDIDNCIFSVKPSTGNMVDSFLTCFFQEFNKKFSTIDFFSRFKDYKIAFFNDLKYNLKRQELKLEPLCNRFEINDSIIEFIAKRYKICICIMINEHTKMYGNELNYKLRLKKIKNKYHKLNIIE